MNINELRQLETDLTRKKRELKQTELIKKQKANLEIEKDVRKRVNDHILIHLLEKTQNNDDPTIRKLYYQLKAYQNNSY